MSCVPQKSKSVSVVDDKIEENTDEELIITASQLRKLSELGRELFLEMDSRITTLVNICNTAPVGKLKITSFHGEIQPVELIWDTSETIPLVAGKLTAPPSLISKIAECRAQIKNEQDTPLWNQCYYTSPQLLKQLSSFDTVIDAQIIKGAYRTVDGDTSHYWVEVGFEGEMYTCETHAYLPNKATNKRGGIMATSNRPDEYIPFSYYSPDDLENLDGPKGDKLAETVGETYRSL